jgi:CubicO group peptidase (beta-lactamase class C family)
MIVILLSFIIITCVNAQPASINKKLDGIDPVIEKILKDWNVPGCGIGIVYKDRLIFAKGYGYRDLEKKLPVTPQTLFQIASNTKLFTATAVGFIVEEGKLAWDKPVKTFVPQIQFYNDELNANVTMRDMLSHRTGISRHDYIWDNSDFTRQELFDRIKYLEPSIPLRQGYLYNNLMYAASGQIVEILSGKTWEEFVTEKIFTPLEMRNSIFVVEDMLKQTDYMNPYYEKRDTTILLRSPYYTKQQGVGPCGSIISNIEDLSKWVIAQMNGGKFNGKDVIPKTIIRETLQPAIPTSGAPDRYFENLNSIYGMGRSTSSYKGHYLTGHGGAIGGIYSHISLMPVDSIGIIVFTNRLSQLPSIIAFTLYDKLLSLPFTPWSERNLLDYLRNKKSQSEARKKPDADRIMGTKPSHELISYSGEYEDPAYGVLKVNYKDNGLSFIFNDLNLPLYHYHYDRFVTPDDEIYGKWAVNFLTNAQGDIDQLKISLDEKEVVFTRKADKNLRDPVYLKKLEGQYEVNGTTLTVRLINNELVVATAPPQHLDPYKANTFRVREFSDQVVEFLFSETGEPTGLKFTSDGRSIIFTRKK